MSIRIKITELSLKGYLNYIIENETFKSDMYDYVLINGKSNIEKLKYMLKDVDTILFCRHHDFMEEQTEYIDSCIEDMQGKGQNLPILKKWTLDEHLEYVKNRPSFELCTEEQKSKRIELAKDGHEDVIIDRKKIAGYDWKYHDVVILRDCIKEEIERLKQLPETEPTKENQQLPTNPLKGKLTETQSTALHTGLCENSLISQDIDSFLYWFGVTDQQPDNLKKIEWTGKSKSLLAYFVDNITDKYDIKNGEKRLIKPFETMFNKTGITNSINDYKKTGQLPIDHEIIDKILK
jgi:hypothetical protein